MYDSMRNDFIVELGKTCIDVNLESKILRILDKVSNNYSIGKKETSLVSYQFQLFKELEIFLQCKKIEGVSIGYLNNVKYAMQNLLMYFRKPYFEITTNDIRVYLNMYKDLKQITLRTLDKYCQYFDTFYTWCVEEEYINRNPVSKIKKIKYEKRNRKSLSSKQLEYMYDACEDEKELALLTLMFCTGCRIQEIADIKLCDINWKTSEVSVIGKGNKQRICLITDRAEIAIKKYIKSNLRDDSEYLFTSKNSKNGHKNSTNNLRLALNKVYDRVKNKIPFKVTPHILRHTTATLLLSSGMPIEQVSKYLGHEQISTTQIYTEINFSDVKSSFMKLLN